MKKIIWTKGETEMHISIYADSFHVEKIVSGKIRDSYSTSGLFLRSERPQMFTQLPGQAIALLGGKLPLSQSSYEELIAAQKQVEEETRAEREALSRLAQLEIKLEDAQERVRTWQDTDTNPAIVYANEKKAHEALDQWQKENPEIWARELAKRKEAAEKRAQERKEQAQRHMWD